MNKKEISHHKKGKIPLLRNYDIVIVGAGPAGCSAAISAARNGADVLLIEKDGYPGGAAVSQLVCIILSTNGVDFQGIWHEFMHTMKDLNGVRDLFKSGYLYRGSLDPEIVKYGWEKMLKENEVDLLYHTYVNDVIIEKDVAKGLILETKAGRKAVKASRIIDCTGDGIICHKAGVPWEQGDYEHDYAMACTKVFRLGNVPDKSGCNEDDWGITEEEYRTIEKNWEKAVANGEYTHPIITSGRVLNYTKSWRRWSLPPHRTEMMIVTSRVLKTNPVDPEELTEAEMEGREQAWQLADFYKKYVPGCEKSYLLDTSNHIGVRSSRRIKGIKRLKDEDVIEFKKCKDGIAKGSWDIDIWPADSYTNPAVPRDENKYKERIERLKEGAYYDIPYGALVANNVDNLMMAGRCISAGHIAESSLRIQQTCMSIGQAAGTAAVLSIRKSMSPAQLDPQIVVKKLKKDRANTKPAFDILKHY